MKVTACVLGGDSRVIEDFESGTVNDLKVEMGVGSNYSATLDGEPVDGTEDVVEWGFYSFAPSVKGG